METLDKFDWLILSELQRDGRLSNAELAQRVGLSAAPCWRRVRALEKAGYITGYRAVIDRHKVGLDVLAFVRLDAERNRGDLTREMEMAIRKIPEVIACHYISGTGTFELQVVARDHEYANQVLQILENITIENLEYDVEDITLNYRMLLQNPRINYTIPTTAGIAEFGINFECFYERL